MNGTAGTAGTASRRIVVYYAVWATICAAVAGLAMTLIHTWFFSSVSGGAAVGRALLSGSATTLAIAGGQGLVAALTGLLLAAIGRELRFTVLLGLLLGLFDFVMYFLQAALPVTELGWGPDLAILAAAAALITALGSRRGA
jgi:hypothetical protein